MLTTAPTSQLVVNHQIIGVLFLLTEIKSVHLTQECLIEEENLDLNENEAAVNPPGSRLSYEIEMDITDDTTSDSCKENASVNSQSRVISPKDVFLSNHNLGTVNDINTYPEITEESTKEHALNDTCNPKKSFMQAFESILKDSTLYDDDKMNILDQEVPSTKLSRIENSTIHADGVPNEITSNALDDARNRVSNER